MRAHETVGPRAEQKVNCEICAGRDLQNIWRWHRQTSCTICWHLRWRGASDALARPRQSPAGALPLSATQSSVSCSCKICTCMRHAWLMAQRVGLLAVPAGISKVVPPIPHRIDPLSM